MGLKKVSLTGRTPHHFSRQKKLFKFPCLLSSQIRGKNESDAQFWVLSGSSAETDQQVSGARGLRGREVHETHGLPYL